MATSSTSGLGLIEAATALREGAITAEKLAGDLLKRIDEFDGTIKAWVYTNPEKVLEEARERDNMRRAGKSLGPLHGVPIALKDIIDTAHIPTEYGCKATEGRIPFDDAWVVSKLRQAGAVILGKTATAELANQGPAETTNPHNAEHTPGGSSSGSAAAVASFMVPGALGTQTGGSVIRPASFCGVYGFKPTYGTIPRSGVLQQSEMLDQVGTFARSLEDVALLTEVLQGYDPADKATSVISYPQPLRDISQQEPPVGIKLGFARTPKWNEADATCQAAFEELNDVLGDDIEDFQMTGTYEKAWLWHQTVMDADNAFHYGGLWEKAKDDIHPSIGEAIERGRKVTATQYLAALEGRQRLLELWDEMLEDFDAILTPATTGEAPKGLENTGDPVFCKLWSLMGVPAISLPLMVGENGLPIGVQLVGRYGDDAKLLRTANWLVNSLTEE